MPHHWFRRGGGILLLFAGIAGVLSLADRAPIHPKPEHTVYTPEYLFDLYLDKAVHQELPGPHAYRILVPYAVAATSRVTSISPMTVDFVFKLLVLIAAQGLFFRYLVRFFPPLTALVGVLLLDVYCGAALSYPVGPSVIETSDILNVAVFCLALKAIYDKRPALLMITLLVGTLNRETTWLILPVAALADWKPWKRWRIAVLGTIMVAVPYFGSRWIIQSPSPDWWLTRDIGGNIPFLTGALTMTALLANARLAIMLGPLALPALYRFREHHRYLLLTAIIIPPFVIIHYLVGRIIEMRLWLPLLIILIPLAIEGLQRMIAGDSAAASGGADHI